jgi:ribosomal protein S21
MQTAKIYVKNNDISKALRVLKKKMLIEGDLKKIREKEHFVSDGERRRLDEKAGRKRWLKRRAQIEQQAVKREQQYFNQRKKAARDNQSKRQVAR